MAIEISKKIEVRDTGVFVTYHKSNPNVYMNLDKKTVQGTIQSFADKTKAPLKTSSYTIPVKTTANIEDQVSEYLNTDTNLEVLINGKKPK